MSLTAPSRFLYAAAIGGTAFCSALVPSDGALTQEVGSATITVTASIAESCSLTTSAISIDFGEYKGAEVVRSPSFSYSCPAGSTVTFRLGGGSINGTGQWDLPNVTNGSSSPLRFSLRDPDGNPWSDNWTVLSTAAGTRTATFQATLLPNQLGQSGVLPGNFQANMRLDMFIGLPGES